MKHLGFRRYFGGKSDSFSASRVLCGSDQPIRRTGWTGACHRSLTRIPGRNPRDKPFGKQSHAIRGGYTGNICHPGNRVHAGFRNIQSILKQAFTPKNPATTTPFYPTYQKSIIWNSGLTATQPHRLLSKIQNGTPRHPPRTRDCQIDRALPIRSAQTQAIATVTCGDCGFKNPSEKVQKSRFSTLSALV